MTDIERFKAAFPDSQDYHHALGYFLAAGVAASQAHALAEQIILSEHENEPCGTLSSASSSGVR